jgi:hypothetical protein
MAIGSLGVAQAAAILLAVTLSWHPIATSPMPQIADGRVASSLVTTDANPPVQTDGIVEIEEGQQIVIRIEGAAARVLDRTPEGVSYNVDDWYLLLNRMEAIASPPVVAVR